MNNDKLISIMEDKLYELDGSIVSGLDELVERAEANPTNIPMTPSEKWNAHPPIHVQRAIEELDGVKPDSYWIDVTFVMLQIMALPALVLAILMWVAISDF